MGRPHKLRRVYYRPGARVFGPCNPESRDLGTTARLTLDEFEAIRLADLQGLYQEDAARKMSISRQTFGTIIVSAHRKIAESLVHSRPLVIEGGHAHMVEKRYQCDACGHAWVVAEGQSKPRICPQCGGEEFHKVKADRHYLCGKCGHAWSVPRTEGKASSCPECRSEDIGKLKPHRDGHDQARSDGRHDRHPGGAGASRGDHEALVKVRVYRCTACAHQWSMPKHEGRPTACPSCGSEAIEKVGKEYVPFPPEAGGDAAQQRT